MNTIKRMDRCKGCGEVIYKRKSNPQWFHMDTRDTHCEDTNYIARPKYVSKKKGKKIKSYGKIFDCGDIHGIWHDFVYNFLDCKEGWDPYTIKWKWTGHRLMKRIQKWARKYPDDVVISVCDDAIYTTSYQVLVAHRTVSDWHGMSIVSVPQLTGKPCIMFMYPRNARDLAAGMEKLQSITPCTEPEDIEEEEAHIDV